MLVSDRVLNYTNFGTVETVIGLNPNHSTSITTEPLYILSDDLAKSFKSDNKVETAHTSHAAKKRRNANKTLEKVNYSKKNKVKKCIYKLFHGKKKKRKLRKIKKIILSILFGLLLLKGLIASIVLKTLIFFAFKGLLIGFFSTIMAPALGFRGMFHHGFGHHHRKNDKIRKNLRVPKNKSVMENHVKDKNRINPSY